MVLTKESNMNTAVPLRHDRPGLGVDVAWGRTPLPPGFNQYVSRYASQKQVNFPSKL